MAIDKRREIKDVTRDPRTVDQRISDFFSATSTSLACFALMIVLVFIEPWLHHVFGLLSLMWWAAVAFDRKRQILPYALPKVAQCTDYNDPKAGRSGYNKAEGILFLGNAKERFYEVWETSSHARQHHLVIGTTGSGKSVLLTGLYANFILLGAGAIFSDAKGTKQQVSELWNLCRRFARDVDFFSINYSTGGISVRDSRRDRLSNRANPCSFASTDQINQMFQSFLPKSSGENQIFQDKAILMFSSIIPALVDRRDLHNEPLHIPKIRSYVNSLQMILDLALDADSKITPRSRAILANYLRTLPNFDWEAFLAARKAKANYDIHAEAFRMFSYAQNYFMRALNSLSDTYGHIYNYEAGEADYLDIVLNRRILVISLPALEKAPTELANLAKINLSNLRGAIAVTTGDRVEGRKEETLDNLPSTSEVPTGIILDEYGYQATEGFAITMAQARSLGFSITVAGQDLANLKMGGESEFDGIFGNAILICMKIRNLKDIGDRVRDMIGEADVAVEGGMEMSDGVLNGYRRNKDVSIQRRARLTPKDLLEQVSGEAILMVGGELGFVPYNTFAPLPKPAKEFAINRFLPISFEKEHKDERVDLARRLDAWVRGRMEGDRSAPGTHTSLPSLSIRPMWEKVHAERKAKPTQEQWFEQIRQLVEGQVQPANAASDARSITAAESSSPMIRRGDAGGGAGGRPPVRIDPRVPPAPSTAPQSPLPEMPADRPEEFDEIDSIPPPRAQSTRGEASRTRPPSTLPTIKPVSPQPGRTAPVTGFGMEVPARRPELIPIRADIDSETEDEYTGDPADLTQGPQLEQIGVQLDAADHLYNKQSSLRRGAGPAAVARDVVAGVRESAVYQPLATAPKQQVAVSHIVKSISAIHKKAKSRRVQGSTESPSATNEPPT